MSTVIPVLRNSTLEQLKDQLSDAAVRRQYANGSPMQFEDSDLIRRTMIRPATEVPELYMPELSPGRLAATDAENAIRIHRYLPELTPVVAADKRLWSYLAHSTFMAYAAWRWPLRDGSSNQVADITTHWFFGKGKGALRRNAIARLWWAASLTHAPWERDDQIESLRKNDDYHYTRILLSNQDIYQGLIERDFGSNLRARIAVLEALEEAGGATAGATRFITHFLKSVNLLSSYTDLGALDMDVSREKLHHVALAAKRATSSGPASSG